MMLEPVLKPVFPRLEADQHTSGADMPRDDDLLVGGQLQVAREVILHLRQGYSAWSSMAFLMPARKPGVTAASSLDRLGCKDDLVLQRPDFPLPSVAINVYHPQA